MAESAIFFLNFYYLVTHAGMTPHGAFERVDRMLAGRVQKGFCYWSRT